MLNRFCAGLRTSPDTPVSPSAEIGCELPAMRSALIKMVAAAEVHARFAVVFPEY